MPRSCLLLLLLPFLFVSCRSVNSFQQRKYLPGVFRQQSHTKEITEDKFAFPEEQNVPLTTGEIPESTEIATTENTTIAAQGNYPHVVPATVALFPENNFTQPSDTTFKPKTKREMRREKRRTDQFRSRASLISGIRSVTSAVLFTLIGLWLGGDGARKFTDGILMLFVLIILILPLYFVAGLGSLFSAIISIVLGSKVRSKHKGEETYEGEKATRIGIMLSILGLIALTLGAILTLPHFLDW